MACPTKIYLRTQTRFCRLFRTHPVLTGCGCSAMQQLKQTQNSVILRLTKKPQQFPLSAQTPLPCVFLFSGDQKKKKKKYKKKEEKKTHTQARN